MENWLSSDDFDRWELSFRFMKTTSLVEAPSIEAHGVNAMRVPQMCRMGSFSSFFSLFWPYVPPLALLRTALARGQPDDQTETFLRHFILLKLRLFCHRCDCKRAANGGTFARRFFCKQLPAYTTTCLLARQDPRKRMKSWCWTFCHALLLTCWIKKVGANDSSTWCGVSLSASLTAWLWTKAWTMQDFWHGKGRNLSFNMSFQIGHIIEVREGSPRSSGCWRPSSSWSTGVKSIQHFNPFQDS